MGSFDLDKCVLPDDAPEDVVGLDPSTDDTEFVGGYDLAADEDVVVDDSSDESSSDSGSDSESDWDSEREDDLDYVLEKCERRAARRRAQHNNPFE